MIENETNKYEQALALYETNLNDEIIAAKVEQIIREKVAENNTAEVKKFLLGSVELTTLKTTDTEESVLKLTERVNQFDEDYPTLWPPSAYIPATPVSLAKVLRWKAWKWLVSAAISLPRKPCWR